MFNQQYWSAQYFDPVWFAPADESHLTSDEVYRPTDAGIAPNNLKFEPIRDAEARLKRPPEVATRVARVPAKGEARAISLRAGVMTGARRARGDVVANGYAVPKKLYPLIGVVNRASGTSDGVARPAAGGSSCGWRQVYPQADGNGEAAELSVKTGARQVRARGVRNLADEEMAILLMRRSLTRRRRSVTTRA